MRLSYRRFDLHFRHAWAIATDVHAGQIAASATYPVVLVELTDAQGRSGLGEGSPSSQYQETWETSFDYLSKIDLARLSFDDVPASMAYLQTVHPARQPARCALNLALLDGAARAAGKSVGDFLGVAPFIEERHSTSFTIGLDTPAMIERKVLEAAEYPVLKMKLGSPDDRANLAALRHAAPHKIIRVDANGAWTTPTEALQKLEWLAADGRVEFVEQPMPAETRQADLVWLRQRSPLPLVGDESYQSAVDATRCAEAYHGVNVKLVKSGGLSAGKAALEAARAQGLKTMLGCMIESSVLITAAAHLAPLTDWLDLDGNVLIVNDPYQGVRNHSGRLSFADVAMKTGLRVSAAG